jgi:rhodanese-related sulfurtransferase
MKTVTVHELKKMMDEGEDFQLIDVREPYEVEICEIGGASIPMGEIADNLEEISREVPVIIHCRSGKRSANVCAFLETQGFDNVINLEGGILAWADEIDTSLEKY